MSTNTAFQQTRDVNAAQTSSASTTASTADARAENMMSWRFIKDRASRMARDVENRVSPTVFQGLVAGSVGAVLSPLPSLFLMMFKFKTWQDWFIGYVLFSLAAAGNVVFAEKGTPKELLIVAGLFVHVGFSVLFATLMSRWTTNVRDTPTIILRSLVIAVGMHYFNLVALPKLLNMQLARDYLDYTGFFPHMLDHLAFGAIVGSTISSIKMVRSGASIRLPGQGVGQGLLSSLANNADRLKNEVGAKAHEAAQAVMPSSSSSSTTSSSATSGLPSVNQIRSAVEHAVESAKETVAGAASSAARGATAASNTSSVPQQATAGKGDTFRGNVETASGPSSAATATTAAPPVAPSYKEVVKATPPTQNPYAETTTTTTQYSKETYKPEESSANPVPSTAEKKRV